jgi:hypothetical protein
MEGSSTSPAIHDILQIAAEQKTAEVKPLWHGRAVAASLSLVGFAGVALAFRLQ